MAQQLTYLAERQGAASRGLAAQAAVGTVALLRGDFGAAWGPLEHYLAAIDTSPPAAPTFYGGHYVRITHFAWLVRCLWGMGYADQAQQRSAEALALAQQLEHPPSLAYAQLYDTLVAQYCRHIAATATRADALMTFAQVQGLEYRVEAGRVLRGWALAMQGDASTGVAHIQQGLEAIDRTGLKLYRPYFLALLAEAYGQAGQPETGLTVLADALTLVAATEERWWEAEVYRLQGELRLYLPSPDILQAEAAFLGALEVARRQQAKALELRAALSLARLWQGRGQRAAACQPVTGGELSLVHGGL